MEHLNLNKPERDPWQVEIEGRLSLLQTEMAANTEVTTEVRDLLATLKGGLRVAAVFSRVARWATPIVALGAALYGLWSQTKGVGK